MTKKVLSVILAATLLLSGCGTGTKSKESAEATQETTTESMSLGLEDNRIDDNNRMYYEVFVYAFQDSDGDGIGDLKGLTDKLDYIEDFYLR